MSDTIHGPTWDAFSDQKSPGTPITYIKFGPNPTDEIPADWASAMLTSLKKSSPQLFGKLLTEALGAVKPTSNGHRQ